MKVKEFTNRGWIPKQLILCLVCVILGLAFFAGHYKLLTLLAAIAFIYLMYSSDLRGMTKWSALLLLGYIIFSGLTIIWAMSGKFFLREYSKIFFAGAIFFFIVLKGRKEAEFGCRIASVLAGTSAILGLISIEAASTGLFQQLFNSISEYQGVFIGFEPGTRMVGVLGNANDLSSILAFGVFFSLALLSEAQERSEKVLYSVFLGINSFALLLCFSMGALACFAVSIVLYLIFAGSGRSAALIRMLEAAIPTAVFGFLALPCFDKGGAVKALPLLLLILNIVAIYLLDKTVTDRLTTPLEKRPKLSLIILAVVILAGVVFSAAGYHLSGAYTFGESIRRSAYPEAGEHVLNIEADGDVSVAIVSQDRAQTMMHTETPVYDGPAANAAFTVPENSTVCYFTFSAAPGTTIQSASVDGAETIRLDYTLLPGSIANRLQGLWANQNFVQRTVFFDDGMKLFRQSPVIGNGVGSFETGVTSVQEFHYETKYIHNHYIQVLLEDGVIGFVFFAAALLSMAVVLIRRHKITEEQPYRWIYPAILAAFFMAALHSAVEVSMSQNIFLCFAFTVFGLIVLLFERPIGAKGEEHDSKELSATKERILRILCIVLAAVFAVTLLGNFFGNHLMKKSAQSTEDFLTNMELASKVDLYEKNDAKLSYVYTVGEGQVTDYYDRANEYADDLLRVQSNSIPQYLISYYLQTGQYVEAIHAAIAGATYSASDPAVWDQSISLLRQAFIDNTMSPLLTNGDTLIPELVSYYEMWQQRNEAAMEGIALDEDSVSFFETVEKLSTSGTDAAEIAEILFP